MGHKPKGRHDSGIQLTIMQRNHHFPVDHEDFSHMLTSINWWSSQKENTTHIIIKQAKGKLEQNMIYHTITYNSIVQDAHVDQSCYDLQTIH